MRQVCAMLMWISCCKGRSTGPASDMSIHLTKFWHLAEQTSSLSATTLRKAKGSHLRETDPSYQVEEAELFSHSLAVHEWHYVLSNKVKKSKRVGQWIADMWKVCTVMEKSLMNNMSVSCMKVRRDQADKYRFTLQENQRTLLACLGPAGHEDGKNEDMSKAFLAAISCHNWRCYKLLTSIHV